MSMNLALNICTGLKLTGHILGGNFTDIRINDLKTNLFR